MLDKMDKAKTEDKTDVALRYRNGLDPLSRQYKERYGKDVTPIRLVSVAPKPDLDDDTLPRGPVGPPGGTLPNLRPYPGQPQRHSPRSQSVSGQKPRSSNQNKRIGNGGTPQKTSPPHRPNEVPKLSPPKHQPESSHHHTYENSAQLRLAAQRHPPHDHRFAKHHHHSPQGYSTNSHIYENAPVRMTPPYSSNRNNADSRVSYVGRNQPQPQAPTPSQRHYTPSTSNSTSIQPPPYSPHRQNNNNNAVTPSNSSSLLLATPASVAASLSPAISATSETAATNAQLPYRGIEKHVVPDLKAPKLDFNATRKDLLSRRTLFEDPEFPAVDSSLYYSRYPPYKITWMRPKDIAAQYRLAPELFVEGTSRFDLRQGELGDCWLLAAAACMSEEPSLLEKVLPPGQSFLANWYAGIFLFRFWHNSEWREVIIDDRLPTDRGQLVFVHSGKRNEFWGALLEKAYAKLFGSYEALKGGHVADALIDFTGGIVESYNLKTRDPPLPSNLSDIIAKALEQNCLVGSGIDPVGDTQETVLPNGLVCGHAYSITDLKEVPLHTPQVDRRVKLVRVRNPWGTRVEWSGAWSDRSAEWTSIPRHERQTLGLVFRDDGEFWLEWNDFLSQFHNLDICYPGPDSALDVPKAWSVQTFHGHWRPGVSAGGRPSLRDTHWSNPQYRVILQDHDDDDNKCSFVIELMQKDRRKLRYKGLEKVTMGFVIYQLSKSYKLPLPKKFFDRHWFVERCDFFTNARQITKRFLLEPGEYLVVPSTFDADVNAEFSLRFFFERDNRAVDTDEPTEIVEPEPHQPELEPPANELTEFQKFFHDIAGQDMEVDAYELRDVINKGLTHDPNHKNISIDACKSMLALVDVNGSGKLDFYQFRYLWDMLKSWRKSFYGYDKNQSGFINGYELKQAVAGQGYRLSSRVLGKLMSRYANKEHHIDLDNFICCMAKILVLFNVFKQNHQNESCTFSLTQWLEVTIAL